ncbi:hypothetical protein C8A00DRAFT_30750 [Chaetomidium leptoderma]|uniref:Early meiotic induction protein 1 n=1 Tax=Chaetomidium leptoderma TaxID=669021 RepID=A0AAN6VRP3_9PEZI|nr:hypothetical protein C8A00DRAFT_30750 [Chaetomidium leptoderma]
MSWFWQSSSSPKPEGASDSSPSAASTTPLPPPPAAAAAAAAPSTQTPPAGSNSATADREMAMFMNMFMKDTQSDANKTQQQQPPPPSASSDSKPSTTTSSWLPGWASSSSPTPTPTNNQTQPPPPKPTRTPESLAMSEHLLPTTMSCRDAFDYAWHCHTPGSQWNAVYRYGSVRACSELWDDFWFCMRTKSFSAEMRAAAVQAHYRAKEETKYGAPGRPSSEDVWESRAERVAPGTAFQAKFEPPIVDDAEFQRVDAERRRRIREMVGAEGGKDN